MKRRFHRSAHSNSVARIVRPAGMTTKAGSGKTIMAIPASRTSPPSTPIITFFVAVFTLPGNLLAGGGCAIGSPG